MQAMAQTKPASSRAMAVTTTCFSLSLTSSADNAGTAGSALSRQSRAPHQVLPHSIQFVAGDAGWKAVTVRRLDEQGSGMDVASW